MSALTGSIKDNRIKLVPSVELLRFINSHTKLVSSLPQNIRRTLERSGYDVSANLENFEDDKVTIKLDFKRLHEVISTTHQHAPVVSRANNPKVHQKADVGNGSSSIPSDTYFYLPDLVWLNNFFSVLRQEHELKCYLHEFLPGCELILPDNEVIARNPVLEARCQKLREEQQNREYRKMTKNVDAVLKNYPEDTLAYQMKTINSQIIAVLQFVFSVVAGFVFGFLGVELIIGSLDFGFRLLLGIMCALIIALAEIYFLAKKLNEIDDDMASPPRIPTSPNKKQKLHKD